MNGSRKNRRSGFFRKRLRSGTYAPIRAALPAPCPSALHVGTKGVKSRRKIATKCANDGRGGAHRPPFAVERDKEVVRRGGPSAWGKNRQNFGCANCEEGAKEVSPSCKS
ncbi:hypothetical protein MTP99_017485 [Tenebrio molitor]|nr:hypothetical protein MTP99_017485 [Tenebrio molitor]